MKKVCLIVIDGFGVAEPGPGNARHLANTPFIDQLEKDIPNCLMDAAGNAVGLPEGQQGASEPGHLTIGAGRVVWQPLERINQAISSEEFFQNDVLVSACKRAKEKGSPLHLVGLYSTGGVHSSTEHFHAMLRLAKQEGIERVMLHLISDGRDTPEQYFCTDFDLLKKEIDELKLGTVASVVGRYFAMDRDKQYADRTKVAYDLYTASDGQSVDDVTEQVKHFYIEAPDGQNTDYYIRPLKTAAFSPIQQDDTVVCINFRSDRMIQIVSALADEDFSEFPRNVRVQDVSCMGPYSSHLPIAFPPESVSKTLGEVVSSAGGSQLRIAETDKYAHVTFFFNAQKHDPFPSEDRLMVESPKVPNFAETPQMSADEVTSTALKNLGQYNLIVMNYANPDLVGHGGKLDAAITACETVDRNLSTLIPALEEAGYEWIITSDHGNAECMLYEDGVTACPTHTTNQIQTFVKSAVISEEDLQTATGLKDIAPICLKMLDLDVPDEMKG